MSDFVRYEIILTKWNPTPARYSSTVSYFKNILIPLLYACGKVAKKLKQGFLGHLLFSLNIFLISIIINMRGKLIKFCEMGLMIFLRRM